VPKYIQASSFKNVQVVQIRYYFPKGTDFSTITDEELSDVEWELNNRPRKRLNFKTPQEVFNEHLNILP